MSYDCSLGQFQESGQLWRRIYCCGARREIEKFHNFEHAKVSNASDTSFVDEDVFLNDNKDEGNER
jgi:hypothetical protein